MHLGCEGEDLQGGADPGAGLWLARHLARSAAPCGPVSITQGQK